MIIILLCTISFNPQISAMGYDYNHLHFADEEIEARRS